MPFRDFLGKPFTGSVGQLRAHNARLRAKAAKGRRPTGGKKGFASKVLAVINRGRETKYVSDLSLDRQLVGQAAPTPASFQRLIPRLNNGTGENQRIGDVISPVKALARFVFYWDPSNANNQDAIVNLWIVTSKSAKQSGTVAALTAGNFLKVGTGVNVDPVDPDQTLMLTRVSSYPLNTDEYTLLKHYRFTMRKGTGNIANQAPAAGIIAPTGVPNSQQFRQITYSWKPPTLKYSEPGAQLPSNHYPVALCYATNADGTAYGDTLRWNINTQLYFKDA